MDALDRRLLAAADRALEDARGAAGGWLACRPGCSECCIGPFPITPLDVRRLRAGLRCLAAGDPARAAAVEARARAQAGRMAEAFPGDARTGELSGDEAAEEAFCERFASTPCPALDPGTGQCDLYASRPLSCRTFGPPVRIGGRPLDPCRLCFQGASATEVERCRVDPDPSGREASALLALGAEEGSRGETVVAFALCRGTTPP